MTDVKPEELNYDSYATDQYDSDIVNSIPGHKELHEQLVRVVLEELSVDKPKVLELGVGTGITTKVVSRIISDASFTLVDFSKQMLQGAKKKLIGLDCKFVLGDYSILDLPEEQDLVMSVIGFHHQGSEEKKKLMLRKIYSTLKKGGLFILGDLMTYDDKELAALNDAYHYHHLVQLARDEQTLKEWAYHHKELNQLSSHEAHLRWLKEIGFEEIKICYAKYNTFLMIAKK